jgi:hypothetical protein
LTLGATNLAVAAACDAVAPVIAGNAVPVRRALAPGRVTVIAVQSAADRALEPAVVSA